MQKCNGTHIKVHWLAYSKTATAQGHLEGDNYVMRKVFVELDVKKGFVKRNHTEVFCMARGTWKANVMNKSHQIVKIFGLRCD